MSSSTGRKLYWPLCTGRASSDGRLRGMVTMPSVFGAREAPLRFTRSSSARPMALLSTRGKGCEGSSVTGVSRGSTCSLKKLVANSRSDLRSSFQRTTRIFASCRAGSRMSVQQAFCFATKACNWRRSTWSRSSLVSPPSSWIARWPSSMSCNVPATRISRNSSRLVDVMERNLTRSRRGLPGSSASSSTRSLKSSQLSSRLK